ncbi:MAG TPA: hypothetical protein VFQ62_02680 [Methylomirabilota bacterium]|nr:hypothetical protein [Methylomirabilota bacterium]
MEARTFLRELVTRLEPNARVVDIDDTPGGKIVRVRLAGTTGVIADCELPRSDVDAAERSSAARGRVTSALKRCADDVVAPVPDGRA